MSGIINKLLNDYREGQGYDLFPPTEKEAVPMPVLTEAKAGAEVTKELNLSRVCRHGSPPENCKHAKFINGKKVCK